MIKAIIFDLDDTLLWDEKSVKEAFLATCLIAKDKYQIEPELLEEAVRKEARELYASYETYEFTQMIGINPFEGLWGTFSDEHEQFQKNEGDCSYLSKGCLDERPEKLGIKDEGLANQLAEQFPQERRNHPFVYDETFEILEQLKGKYKMVLLTNGSPSLQNTKLELTPELVPYFDEIVISGSFGRGKPDVSIFEHVLELVNINKDEAVMVGDNLMTDILGATRLGMKSVWINRTKKEQNEVKPTFEITALSELFLILNSLKEEGDPQ